MWAATIAAILALIALDFVTVSRNPHEVTLREAGAWSAVYIGVALAFGVLVWWVWGAEFGAEYLAGWLVEKTLSIDNLFVFVIIMTSFAVPATYQHRVLLFGVTAALVMRAVFIAVGAAAIQRFSVTFLAFGGCSSGLRSSCSATATRTRRSMTTPCCAGPGGGSRPPTATPAPASPPPRAAGG